MLESTTPRRHDRCNELWAYLVVDPEDNCEGVVALHTPQGPLPAVGADNERMLSLRDIMVEEALKLGVEIRLVRFATRENVDVLNANS